ncbi:MAG: hypothetical protein LIO37_03900 [Clostridiales bacterium]|nr:hypothetical protein [Clostridiales bacterium]
MDRIKGKSISRKIIISCLLLLIIASFTVRPTLAWLSATTDPVINYFAGGSIALTLDEAPVDADGQEIDGNRVQENHYKYMAGAKLDKDPTVTVLVGSEECYVYVCVDNELPDDFFSIDIDTDAWIEVETSDSSTIYRYVRTVDASEEDVVLAPVFTTVTVSAELTSEDIAELGTKTLAVTAFAIQTASLDKEAADELAVEYFFNGASIALLGSAVNNETGAEVTELTEEAEETEVTEVPEETEVAEETETAEETEET